MKKIVLMTAVVLLVASVAMALTLPRNETLYFGGSMWGPLTNFNPLNPNHGWGVDLVYPTLFMYNPLTNQMVPYLAESGNWVNSTTYDVKLRKDAQWTDGQPVTAQDVKYTFELPLTVSQLVPVIGLKSVNIINDYEVQFVFSQPNYPNFYGALYGSYIVPEHIWSKMATSDIFSYANLTNPVGCGPYKFLTYNPQEIVLERNDNWFGNNFIGKPAPKYVAELAVSSNNVALGLLLQGQLDISNFYLPGIESLIKPYNLVAWNDKPPYMLSSNTALLFLNNSVAPLNDPQFRKALAYAIGPTSDLTQRVYAGQVPNYVDPLGLLPIESWMQFEDKSVVSQYGYTYDPAKAAQILDQLGYKKGPDGWRTMPNGQPIKLSIICPYGWTDWMAAERIVAEDLQKIGLNVTADFPDYSTYWNNFTSGNYTMAINNFGSGISMTPYTYFYWLFGYPIQQYMYNGNFERYNNPTVVDLLNKISSIPLDNTKELQPLYSQIEKAFLQDMPVIPLWYNGMWYLANQSVWTNFPNANNPYAFPSTWTNNGVTTASLYLYTGIKPVK
ncbi:ABC transporter substrate-binding protein [Athalassotoga saccharophila]|uniref:ABC transporter substrate-binding protein n=1 Tax=Athalassotoga saccharophila TaxID=1441386 RepID=UPI00137A1619|nr:ABC transporter substrate-binding protein [Athalassotoga saccharophila]BBJ28998.1 oligopeptide-binding protein AppA [Athalassotoga saccharophila]